MNAWSVISRRVASFFVGISLLFACFIASAAYTGPGATVSTTTVSAILKQPKDDMQVVLKGYLIRKVKHETYMFSDGTGEVLADIDDDDFPPQTINEKTTVEITGEVDIDRKSGIEIDVKSLRIIK